MYYKILGVDSDASGETIRRAFREAAKKTHPDAGGSEEEFTKILEAYQVLHDPERRRIYDMATVGEKYVSKLASNTMEDVVFVEEVSHSDLTFSHYIDETCSTIDDAIILGWLSQITKVANDNKFETEIRLAFTTDSEPHIERSIGNIRLIVININEKPNRKTAKKLFNEMIWSYNDERFYDEP